MFEFIEKEMIQDPAHDINHVKRVVKTARNLCAQENAKLEVVLPAAYLHDCFTFAKNHPERSKSLCGR
ncbi:HD domain-containing protein, partial [Vibrio tubiashii]